MLVSDTIAGVECFTSLPVEPGACGQLLVETLAITADVRRLNADRGRKHGSLNCLTLASSVKWKRGLTLPDDGKAF